VPLAAILVVPCYDEAARLDVERYREWLASHGDAGLVLVDDGSRDATADRLRAIRKGFEDRVDVLELPTNAGKAEAVRRGVLHAFERAPGAIGAWDADLSAPLEALPAYLAVLAGDQVCEMVFGARVPLLGRRIARRPLRHYAGRLFAAAVSLTLGLTVYDSQCPAKLFRSLPSTRALFEERFVSRWLFEVEVLARLLRARRGTALPQPERVVRELPLEEWTDVAGSKISPAELPRIAADLVRIRWRYRA